MRFEHQLKADDVHVTWQTFRPCVVWFTKDSRSLLTPLTQVTDWRQWYSHYKSPLDASSDEKVEADQTSLVSLQSLVHLSGLIGWLRPVCSKLSPACYICVSSKIMLICIFVLKFWCFAFHWWKKPTSRLFIDIIVNQLVCHMRKYFKNLFLAWLYVVEMVHALSFVQVKI